MLIVLNIIHINEPFKFLLFILIYLLIGYDILRKVFLGITRGQLFSEDFLMSIATIRAFCLALYTQSGDYNEQSLIVLKIMQKQ